MSENGNGHRANGSGHAAQGNDYKVPAPRAEWIVKRKEEAARTGDTNMSQMHFARKGLVTEEMAYVAHRERLKGKFVRDEVAAGLIDPISGPGVCGAEFPLKVAALGESNSSFGFADELRPPAGIGGEKFA